MDAFFEICGGVILIIMGIYAFASIFKKDERKKFRAFGAGCFSFFLAILVLSQGIKALGIVLGSTSVKTGVPFDITCKDGTTTASHILQPSGTRIIFINLCGYQGVLSEVDESGLPAPLTTGSKFKFTRAVNVDVLKKGVNIKELPKDSSLEIVFSVNVHASEEVLFWNGSMWKEIPGKNPDMGFYKITTSTAGIFVLAEKE
jgi:hypothetical protein